MPGELDAARRVLEGTVRRIREYAGNDPEINRAWKSLEQERPRYEERVMDAISMKHAHYAAEMDVKSRPCGRARRSS